MTPSPRVSEITNYVNPISKILTKTKYIRLNGAPETIRFLKSPELMSFSISW